MAKKPVMIGNDTLRISAQGGIVTKPAKATRISVPTYVPTSSDLDQIVAEFHKLTSNMYEIPPAKPNEENYRQVLVSGWPRNIHFEFISRKNPAKGRKAGLSLEFHDETREFLRLKEIIPQIAKSVGLYDGDIFWKNPALVIHISNYDSFAKVAESMLELINKTKDPIAAAISGIR